MNSKLSTRAIATMRLLDMARGTYQTKILREYLHNQFSATAQSIEEYQQKKLQEITQYHFHNNPAYRKHLEKYNIRDVEKLPFSDLPVLTKNFFRENPDHSISKNIHITKYSGGSTGVPLQVNLSKQSFSNFWPALWRAFEANDIYPGDKMVMIAGPSLFNKRTFKRKVFDLINNFQVFSAFDLNDKVFRNIYDYIKTKNVKGIYGYTSSILSFLNYLEQSNLRVNLQAIFTTSETFIPRVRALAKEYCNCDVIDTYGANDGGVFGFECQHHSGYHLNYERCFVEIIDHKIICTDLLNTATPFIRYEVGDCTNSSEVIKDRCSCGRSLFRIENVSGRINDYIIDSDGMAIHSEFFSHLFSNDSLIKQYQVRSTSSELVINLLSDSSTQAVLLNKYVPLLAKKIKKKHRIVFNEAIVVLPNMKTPILVKN